MRRRTLSIDGWISLSTISIDLQDSMVSTATASVMVMVEDVVVVVVVDNERSI